MCLKPSSSSGVSGDDRRERARFDDELAFSDVKLSSVAELGEYDPWNIVDSNEECLFVVASCPIESFLVSSNLKGT